MRVKASRPECEQVQDLLLSVAERMAGVPVLVPPAREAARQVVPSAETWLALLDASIRPSDLRHALTAWDVEDADLAPLVRHYAGKQAPSEDDLHKLDWLLTFIFRRRGRQSGWLGVGALFAGILDLLGELEEPGLPADAEERLIELGAVQTAILECHSLTSLFQTDAVRRGRRLKLEFLRHLRNAEVLASFVHYNVLVGEKFSELDKAAGAWRSPTEGQATVTQPPVEPSTRNEGAPVDWDLAPLFGLGDATDVGFLA